jgi:hypothetical protein
MIYKAIANREFRIADLRLVPVSNSFNLDVSYGNAESRVPGIKEPSSGL